MNQPVLLINDDPTQLKLQTFTLEQAGYQVRSSTSAKQGLAMCAVSIPDLVVSDVVMPGMDGIEFCRELRADERFDDVPIMLVSGLRHDTDAVVDGIYAGADDYVQIPCDPMQFIAKTAQVIERKRSSKALRESEHRLRIVFENSAFGIALVSPEGFPISTNPAFQQMLGYSGPELEALSFADIVHPDDVETDRALFQEVRENKRDHYQIERQLITKSGRMIWAGITVSAVRDSKGKLRYTTSMVQEITDRRLAEKALRESRAHLALAQQAAQIGSFELDLQTKRSVASSEWNALYGFPAEKEEHEFDEWVKLVHPDDLELVENAHSSAVDSGVLDSEFRIVLEDGTIRWILAKGKILYDDNHIPTRLVAVNMDITERKHAEKTVHFQKTLLESQSEASIDGVLIVAPEGHVISHNTRFREMWDIPSEWLDGVRDAPYLAEMLDKVVDRDALSSNMSLLHPGPNDTANSKILLKDGRIFESYTAPVRDRAENYYGRVWFFRDITERSRLEKEAAEAKQHAIDEYVRLLDKLAVLGQSLGTATDLATIYTAVLTFTKASVPCSALFISRYSRERSNREGLYLWYNGLEIDVEGIDPIPVADGPVGQAIKNGEVNIVNDYLKHKNSNWTSLYYEENESEPKSALIAPMKLMGTVIGTIEVQSYDENAFFEEHSTAMRMAANLTAAAIENMRLREHERTRDEKMRLSQRLESVGRLAGGIAHDFNNMLTVINGYSDLTLRKLQNADPLRVNLQEIRKAGERSATLTNQLLAFSRKQVLRPKVLDINDTITDTLSLLERLIGEDIEMAVSLAPDLEHVQADPGQLSQVLMNLSVNARDSMPRGGVLRIETSNAFIDEDFVERHLGSRFGPHVIVLISDTGSGMSEDDLIHLFEPFYTTKDIGKGTGLGLATVYGIVKQSNGYISVDSTVGVGTTFRIYLPHARDLETSESEPPTDGFKVPVGSEKILLVEDEDTVRELARQILDSCGYAVTAARSGLEAIELVERGTKFDLLLTDVVMPSMSGRELVDKLQKVSPHTPVLFMSGYTDDAIIRKGIMEINTNFIQKPFTFNDLAHKVRDVIDSKTN